MTSIRRFALYTAVLALSAIPTSAQDIDESYDVTMGPLTQILDGTLSTDDPALESGEYIDSYEIEIEGGKFTRIDLKSDDFDTYLIVMGPGGEQFESDDFHGIENHSRVDIEAATAGTWQIGVTSAYEGETGSYTFTVTRYDSSPPAPPGVVSKEFTNQISAENTMFAPNVGLHTFHMEPGDRITATITSSAFEPLVIYGPSDGGDDERRVSFNGELEYTAEEPEELSIGVASGNDAYGTYTFTYTMERAYAYAIDYDYPEFGPGVARIAREAGSGFENIRGEQRMTILKQPEWPGTIALPGATECLVGGLGSFLSYTCDLGESADPAPLKGSFDAFASEMRTSLNGWEFSTEPPEFSVNEFIDILQASTDGARISLELIEARLSSPNRLRVVISQ